MDSSSSTLQEGLLSSQERQQLTEEQSLARLVDGEVVASEVSTAGNSSLFFSFCLALISLFGGTIYGYNVGSSAYLDQVTDVFDLGSGGQQLVSSAATVTDAISMTLASAFLLDRFGRRKTVLLGACANVLGCVLGVLSTSFTLLVWGRFVQGVGNGVSILSVPMLISESAPHTYRGMLVSFFQVGVVLGFTLPYAVQLGFDDWKITYVSGGAPGVALIILLFLVWSKAESKSWKAASVEVADDLEQTRNTESDASKDNQLVDFRKGALMAVVMAFTNNSSDAIIFYGPQIIQKAGLGSKDSLWTAFGLAAINVPAVIIVLFLIDRFPRRKMILSGLAAIIVCYIVIGITFIVADGNSGISVVVISFLVLMMAYQAGPGTLYLVVLPELFVQSQRARGMAIGTFSMSLFSILCNGTMLATIDFFGVSGTFLGYGFLYVLCLVIIYRHLPESKGVVIVEHHHL